SPKSRLLDRFLDSELPAAGFADAVRGPLRLPNQIDFNFADVGNSGKAVVYLLEDEAAGRALRRGERHGDFDPLAGPGWGGIGVGAGLDGVDQAQVDEVQ